MATLNATNLKHGSSSSNNIVLASDGSTTISNLSGGVGKILQVVEASSNTTVSTSGTTEHDLLTLSITPASSSNKIFVFANFIGQTVSNTNAKAWVRVYRGTASGTKILNLAAGNNDAIWNYLTMAGQKLDSPNTTSAQTYTMTLARLSGGTNYVTSDGQTYTLQAMEVAA